MATLTDAQLDALAAGAGFSTSERPIARAVARAESGGQTDIVSTTGDYGLWQINHRAHPNYDTNRLLSDPAYNARAAFAISKGGSDWSPWTAYKTGAYQKYLSGTPATGDTSSKGGILGIDLPNPLDLIPGAGTAADAANTVTGGWVDTLVAKAGSAMLALLFVAGGLALIGIAILQLTNNSPTAQKAVQTAGTVATAAAVI